MDFLLLAVEAVDHYPGRLSVRIGYEEPLAHRLLGGADLLLHPSRFEPCGLTQLYGLAYGTLPLVRRVGGLADTDADTRLETIDTDATGFVFDDFALPALQQALARACALHRRPVDWKRVRTRAMTKSFGWDRAARAYLGLYQELAPLA